MKNSNQNMHFLNIYRAQLRNELDQMRYGQVSQSVAKHTADIPDRLGSALIITSMMLVIGSVFLV